MFFGHLPELLVVLVVALLIFGPKRMIEIGSALGKAFRELRNATKDLTWSGLLSSGEDEKPTTLSRLSQLSQTYGSANGSPAAPHPVTATTPVVDADTPGETPGAN